MEIVVHDHVAVLQVQALGHHIGGDQDVDFLFIPDFDMWVGQRREPGRHAGLALVGAVDRLDVRALSAGVDVLVEILGRVGVLAEDQHLVAPGGCPSSGRPAAPELGVLVRGDRLHQLDHLPDELLVRLQVLPQQLLVEVCNLVAARERP